MAPTKFCLLYCCSLLAVPTFLSAQTHWLHPDHLDRLHQISQKFQNNFNQAPPAPQKADCWRQSQYTNDSTFRIHPIDILTLDSTASLLEKIELASLLNRNWKNSIQLDLNGIPVYVGGQSDKKKDPDPYLGLLTDSWAYPLFFNVKQMLCQDFQVQVGTTVYLISLDPAYFDKWNSKITLANKGKKEDKHTFTIRTLTESSYQTQGPESEVRLGEFTYRIFYYQDTPAQLGEPPRETKTIGFMLRLGETKEGEGEDFKGYVIGQEEIPTAPDQVAVIKLFKNKIYGLRLDASRNTLEIYSVPNAQDLIASPVARQTPSHPLLHEFAKIQQVF